MSKAQNFLLMGPLKIVEGREELEGKVKEIISLCQRYVTLAPESADARKILSDLPFGEDDGIEISWVGDMNPYVAIQYLDDSWEGRLEAAVERKGENLSIYFKGEPSNLYDENWDDNYDYEWMIMHFLSTCDFLKIVGIH